MQPPTLTDPTQQRAMDLYQKALAALPELPGETPEYRAARAQTAVRRMLAQESGMAAGRAAALPTQDMTAPVGDLPLEEALLNAYYRTGKSIVDIPSQALAFGSGIAHSVGAEGIGNSLYGASEYTNLGQHDPTIPMSDRVGGQFRMGMLADPRYYLERLAPGAIESIAPYVGAGLVAGPAGVAGLGAAQMGGQAMREGMEAGMDPQQAGLQSVVRGVVGAALERNPLSGAMGGGRGLLSATARGAGAEAVTEGLQTGADKGIAAGFGLGEDKPLEEHLLDVFEASLTGAAGGGPVSGVATAIGNRRNKAETPQGTSGGLESAAEEAVESAAPEGTPPTPTPDVSTEDPVSDTGKSPTTGKAAELEALESRLKDFDLRARAQEIIDAGEAATEEEAGSMASSELAAMEREQKILEVAAEAERAVAELADDSSTEPEAPSTEPEAPSAPETEMAALSRRVSERAGTEVSLSETTPTRKVDLQAVKIGKLLGRKVRFFDGGKEAYGVSGFRDSDTIWLNKQQNANSIKAVFSHELTHTMEGTKAWGAFAKAVGAAAVKGAGQRYAAESEAGGITTEGVNMTLEGVARLVEENALNATFWNKLAKESPGVIDRVRTFLRETWNKLGVTEAARLGQQVDKLIAAANKEASSAKDGKLDLAVRGRKDPAVPNGAPRPDDALPGRDLGLDGRRGEAGVYIDPDKLSMRYLSEAVDRESGTGWGGVRWLYDPVNDRIVAGSATDLIHEDLLEYALGEKNVGGTWTRFYEQGFLPGHAVHTDDGKLVGYPAHEMISPIKREAYDKVADRFDSFTDEDTGEQIGAERRDKRRKEADEKWQAEFDRAMAEDSGLEADADAAARKAEGIDLAVRSKKGVDDVARVATEYARKAGIDYQDRPGEYVKVDEPRARRIADEYERMEHAPNDPEVKAAYKALDDETMAQYEDAVAAGYTFEPWDQEGQPYANSDEMIADIRDNKHLWYFKTVNEESSFGTGESAQDLTADDNPLLRRTGIVSRGYDQTVNDIFRAIHDFYGHAKEGHQFGPRGEENAWRVHSRMFSPTARRAMTTETRGQNSWVNYGAHMRREDGAVPKRGDSDFVPLQDRDYAEQKTGLLPKWVTELDNDKPLHANKRGGLQLAVRQLPSGNNVMRNQKVPRGVKASGKKGDITIMDVARYFQALADKRGIKYDKNKLKKELQEKGLKSPILKQMASTLSKELNLALELDPENSGEGWYEAAIEAMEHEIGKVFPELDRNRPEYDEDASTVFRMVNAVTSNGQKVNDNLNHSLRVYKAWKESGTGKLDGVLATQGFGGERATSIADAINDIQWLIDNLADTPAESIAKLRKFLHTKGEKKALETAFGELSGIPVKQGWNRTEDRETKEIKATRGKIQGLTLDGELVDEQVYGALLLFGPKLGSFYLNQSGYHDMVTMDLWFARSWNRLAGTLVDESQEKVDKQMAALRSAVKRGVITEANIRPGEDVLDDLGVDERASYDWAKWRQGLFSQKGAHEKAGQSKKHPSAARSKQLVEAMEPIAKAPTSGWERRVMRRVFAEAVRIANKSRPADKQLNLADAQAIWWYYEKRLWALTQGKPVKDDVAYDSAAAEWIAEEQSSPKQVKTPARGSAGPSFGRRAGSVDAPARAQPRVVDGELVPVQLAVRGRRDPEGRGRPDLANPATEPGVRDLVDDVDEERNEAGEPETRSDSEVEAEASRRVEADAEGEADKLIRAAEEGTLLTDVETVIAQRLIEEHGLEALAVDKKTQTGGLFTQVDALKLIHAYRRAGTEAARAFRQRRDRSLGPAENTRRVLADAVATPSPALGRQLEKARGELDAASREVRDLKRQIGELEARAKKTEPSDAPGSRPEPRVDLDADAKLAALRTRLSAAQKKLAREVAKRDALIEKQAKELQEVTAALAEANIRIDQLTEEELEDGVVPAQALRLRAEKLATAFDMATEYWINSILSGPKTQIVNITGNLTFGLSETVLRRFVESVTNIGVRAEGGARPGEMVHAIRGLFPGMVMGAKNALRSFSAEIPILESDLRRARGESVEEGDMAEQLEVSNRLRRGAIPGKVGKVVRTPTRILLAADEMTKAIFARMEVGARAYRIAKTEGLKGKQLSERMGELVTDSASEAWAESFEEARRLTFQAELGTIGKSIVKLRNENPWLTFFVPFVTTPVNIAKEGFAKTPLVSALTLGRGAKSILSYSKGNGWTYSREKINRDVANNVMAWGVALALWSMLSGDDDDDLPRITGATPKDAGERELAYRAAPPMHIRIGGRWYDYGRIEPFATLLGTAVDSINDIKKAGAGEQAALAATSGAISSLTRQVNDKTFLRGLSDMIKVFQSDRPVEDTARWAVNYTTSWVPNVIRASVRGADDQIREARVWGDLEGGVRSEFARRAGRRIGYKAFPMAGAAPPPKYDVWGRPAKKGYSSGGVASDLFGQLLHPAPSRATDALEVDRFILRYNNANPGDEIMMRLPGTSFTVTEDGKRVKAWYTDEEYEELLRDGGQLAARRLSRMRWNMERLPKQQADMIRRAVSKSRADIKKRIMARRRRGSRR